MERSALYVLTITLFAALFTSQCRSLFKLGVGRDGTSPVGIWPIYFFGYYNNEHYMHYMPGIKTRRMGRNVVLKCPPGSEVHVTRASYGTPQQGRGDEWMTGQCDYDYSLPVIRQYCKGRPVCQIDKPSRLFLGISFNEGCKAESGRFILAADFECIPTKEPATLFHPLTGFSSGVTPHYSIASNQTAECSLGELISRREARSIGDAKKLCDTNRTCAFFVWDTFGSEVKLCSGNGWQRTTKSDTYIVGTKPSQFKAADYAVYIDYLGICLRDNILTKIRGIHTTADAARHCSDHNTCTFATFTQSGGLQSLSGYHNHLWLCQGTPTMIPVT